MANYVAEWYGYRPEDNSPEAQSAAANKFCPFLASDCKKKGGVCSVLVSGAVTSVCPKRFYGSEYKFLSEIAIVAFEDFLGDIDVDPVTKIPRLHLGSEVRKVARSLGKSCVGVFAQKWDSEVKLPAAVEGGARYSVDFTLVCVDSQGNMLGFAPIEVQTIDTTNSYKASVEALEFNRSSVPSKFGANWENVNKRILPQLITKGLMLQGEKFCKSGIFFVTPGPVYDRIMRRLGSESRLRQIPLQPGSITFIRMDPDFEAAVDGFPMPLHVADPRTISTSDMSLAFITPDNLPAAGAYEQALLKKMKG